MQSIMEVLVFQYGFFKLFVFPPRISAHFPQIVEEILRKKLQFHRAVRLSFPLWPVYMHACADFSPYTLIDIPAM